MNKSGDPNARKSRPVSLAPLSFEDALKALVATPSMTEKPKRPPAIRRKNPINKKPV